MQLLPQRDLFPYPVGVVILVMETSVNFLADDYKSDSQGEEGSSFKGQNFQEEMVQS